MYPHLNSSGSEFINPQKHADPLNLAGHSAGGTDSAPLIRVVVAENLRVAPPVPAPPAASLTLVPSVAGRSQQPNPPIDFSYEKNILEELESTPNLSFPSNSDHGLGFHAGQEKCEALVSQCCSTGEFSRDEASLALSIAVATTGMRVDGNTVRQSARNLKHMTSMGFSKADSVGALVAKNGNLLAAIDML